MLNQLIESKNHREENARKNGFLVTTLGVLVAVLLSGWTYSLFAKNYGMGAGDFDLSSIVAPVPINEVQPPAPKLEPKLERTQPSASNKIVLKELYEDMSSNKIPPKDLSGVKDVVNAQQFDLSKIQRGDVNLIPENAGRSNTEQEQGCGLCSNSAETKPDKDTEEKIPEVVKATPKPSPAKPPVPQSLGVINGKASYLAKPAYPATAKAVRAEGAVNVQVTIDEKGNVISASVVSGNPLLRAVSEAAARQSKFTPTMLSNQPVKVTGVIVYQFKL